MVEKGVCVKVRRKMNIEYFIDRIKEANQRGGVKDVKKFLVAISADLGCSWRTVLEYRKVAECSVRLMIREGKNG